jgi:hypothetical protein
MASWPMAYFDALTQLVLDLHFAAGKPSKTKGVEK